MCYTYVPRCFFPRDKFSRDFIIVYTYISMWARYRVRNVEGKSAGVECGIKIFRGTFAVIGVLDCIL